MGITGARSADVKMGLIAIQADDDHSQGPQSWLLDVLQSSEMKRNVGSERVRVG